MSNRVLDVPALLDITTRKTQFMRARWHVARELAATLVVPWCVAAQAARDLDEAGIDELRLVLAAPMVVLSPRDAQSALACGRMTGRAPDTVGWDATQIVHESVSRGWPVVTSEDHLDRLLDVEPYLTFERLP
jgi:hypothetical protein